MHQVSGPAAEKMVPQVEEKEITEFSLVVSRTSSKKVFTVVYPTVAQWAQPIRQL